MICLDGVTISYEVYVFSLSGYHLAFGCYAELCFKVEVWHGVNCSVTITVSECQYSCCCCFFLMFKNKLYYFQKKPLSTLTKCKYTGQWFKWKHSIETQSIRLTRFLCCPNPNISQSNFILQTFLMEQVLFTPPTRVAQIWSLCSSATVSKEHIAWNKSYLGHFHMWMESDTEQSFSDAASIWRYHKSIIIRNMQWG